MYERKKTTHRRHILQRLPTSRVDLKTDAIVGPLSLHHFRRDHEIPVGPVRGRPDNDLGHFHPVKLGHSFDVVGIMGAGNEGFDRTEIQFRYFIVVGIGISPEFLPIPFSFIPL